MPRYIAHYGFAYPESSLRPDDQKHGLGECPITTDEVPQTAEQFLEIARTIGLQGGYAQVAITKLEIVQEYVTEDDGTVYEGEIVID